MALLIGTRVLAGGEITYFPDLATALASVRISYSRVPYRIEDHPTQSNIKLVLRFEDDDEANPKYEDARIEQMETPIRYMDRADHL